MHVYNDDDFMVVANSGKWVILLGFITRMQQDYSLTPGKIIIAFTSFLKVT